MRATTVAISDNAGAAEAGRRDTDSNQVVSLKTMFRQEDKVNHEEKHHEGKAEEIIALEEEILEELIDLEEWVKAGKKPCKAKSYRIRIDKEKFTVHVHKMTGKEILGLVHKTPEKYLLSEKFRGGRVEPIAPNQEVEFHRCEVERFQTLSKEPTEG
jgi:Multiubiquitin